MLGLKNKIFNYGSEEFKLRKKVEKLLKNLSKAKTKHSIIKQINSPKNMELINSILLELGMHQEKGCYDPKIVDKILEKLEDKGIFLEEDYFKIINSIKNYLYFNLNGLNSKINRISLNSEKDIELLIKILNDPTLSTKSLLEIVRILLKKIEFINCSFKKFNYIIDCIVSHPSFNEEVLDIVLLFEGKKKIVYKKYNFNNGQTYGKQNKSKIDYIIENELEIMFLKSYFLVNANVDLSRYRNYLLKGSYLTIIISVFKNQGLLLQKKKEFLNRLVLDTLEKLNNYLSGMNIPYKEDIIKYINLLLIIKNNKLNFHLKLKALEKYAIYDLEILLSYMEENDVDNCNNKKELIEYIKKIIKEKEV